MKKPTLLTHDQLMEQWDTDCKIDQTSLKHVMYNHPMLHAKYLRHLQDYKFKLRKHVVAYANLKSVKIRYFNGELSGDELKARGWDQYLFRKPLKAELEALIEADVELQRLQEESVYLDVLVASCESIMKDINSRYYLFRNLVEYERFQAGV